MMYREKYRDAALLSKYNRVDRDEKLFFKVNFTPQAQHEYRVLSVLAIITSQVPKVYDIFELDADYSVIVMELLTGRTLADEVNLIPIDEALSILCKCFELLEHINSRLKFTHYDLHFSNIMVVEGIPYFIDLEHSYLEGITGWVMTDFQLVCNGMVSSVHDPSADLIMLIYNWEATCALPSEFNSIDRVVRSADFSIDRIDGAYHYVHRDKKRRINCHSARDWILSRYPEIVKYRAYLEDVDFFNLALPGDIESIPNINTVELDRRVEISRKISEIKELSISERVVGFKSLKNSIYKLLTSQFRSSPHFLCNLAQSNGASEDLVARAAETKADR